MLNSTSKVTSRTRRWIWGSAGVVAFFGLVGACGGGDESTPPASGTAPSSAAASTPGPRARLMTVTEVIDADTVRLIYSSREITAQLLGIEAPQAEDSGGVGCFGSESVAWAQRVLLGKRVLVTHDPTQGATDGSDRELVYLRLPSGNDYSVQATSLGYAKSTVDFVSESARITAAESTAQSASRGLWGAPCYGDISVPVKTAEPAPDRVEPDLQPVDPVDPVEEPPAGGESSVYYENCTAARAAGAAPVRVGDPGYAPHLDRDGDGVGCED